MINPDKLHELGSLIEEKGAIEALPQLAVLHPAEIAEVLAGQESSEALVVLRALDPQFSADVFCELPVQFQVELVGELDNSALAQLLLNLPPDERVDLLKALPEERTAQILPVLAQKERDEIKLLAAHPEGTAGSIMTTDYIALPVSLTAKEAIERIRLEGAKKESIYTIFAVDDARVLKGAISLADLILSPPDTLLAQLAQDQTMSIRAGEDREDAVYMISRYGLVALPVVDDRGSILGIITHDDAIYVMELERTEDLERFMAISGKQVETSYLNTSTWTHFSHRVGWLIALAAVGLISGAILRSYESALSSLLILAFYMPMLADTGGNTGSQSAAMVIRALALKEISARDSLKILWKETKIALLLGLVLGVLAFLRVSLTGKGVILPPHLDLSLIGIAIGIALAIQVVSSTIIGALLPLLAAALGFDPALIASPALTTIVDITGLFIYFSTARLILGV